MHVFLSEYLTCGALAASAELKPSLAVEGAAMLRALTEDAVAAGYAVSIVWDPACGEFGVTNVAAHFASSPADAERLFRELTRAADTTLVIAPEFDGILEDRCRLLAACGGRSSGSSAEAIALCADKLQLAMHLQSKGVATIETSRCQRDGSILTRAGFKTRQGEAPALSPLNEEVSSEREMSFPLVIKPQFGAGSIHSFVLSSADEFQKYHDELVASGMELIAQPFIAGQPLSIAAIVSRNGIEMFPLCTQNIRGRRLEYAGGTVPAAVDDANSVIELARRAIAAVPGLYGYVGVDLILPHDTPPVVVEINPRLTSSYHGYRRTAMTNLAPRVLEPGSITAPTRWRTGVSSFRADGMP